MNLTESIVSAFFKPEPAARYGTSLYACRPIEASRQTGTSHCAWLDAGYETQV